jgi:hypothetical protein
LKRAIQADLENPLAKLIISGKIQEGDRILADTALADTALADTRGDVPGGTAGALKFSREPRATG